jgi:hypothetical protein
LRRRPSTPVADMMGDDQADEILTRLSREGFGLPYMARSRDYATPAELQAADDEAWRENRKALRQALAGWEDDEEIQASLETAKQTGADRALRLAASRLRDLADEYAQGKRRI